VLNLDGTGLVALTIEAGAGADLVDASDLGGLGVGITGGTGDDRLRGGAGADTFTWQVGDGVDLIDGGAGPDRLTMFGTDAAEGFELGAAAGHFTMAQTNRPGSGLDAVGVEDIRLEARGGADVVTVHDLAGTDVHALTVDAGAGDDFVNAAALSVLGVTLRGGTGNDVLVGGQGADDIDGGAGSDLLVGGAGADRLRGGTGNDVLLGGPGEDHLVDAAGDNVLLETLPSGATLSPRDQALIDWAAGDPDLDGLALDPRTRRWGVEFVIAVA